MRKFYILGVAFGAAFAFSAVAATAAFAKEWLWTGKLVTVLLAAVTEEELLMEVEETNTGIYIDFLCSVRLVGSVGPNGEGEITLVEGLSGEDHGFDCAAHSLCSNELAEFTAIHLPWHSQIELMTNGEILDVFTGTGSELGYKIECPTPFGKFIDECKPNAVTHEQTVLTNTVSDVNIELSENETISPRWECSPPLGRVTAGLFVGVGLTTNPEGGTLSVS